jgi:ribosomal protein L32E
MDVAGQHEYWRRCRVGRSWRPPRGRMSDRTCSKWVGRYRLEGEARLLDRLVGA